MFPEKLMWPSLSQALLHEIFFPKWILKAYSWLCIKIHNLLNDLERENKCIIYESVYIWSRPQSVLVNLCQKSDYGNQQSLISLLPAFLSPVFVNMSLLLLWYPYLLFSLIWLCIYGSLLVQVCATWLYFYLYVIFIFLRESNYPLTFLMLICLQISCIVLTSVFSLSVPLCYFCHHVAYQVCYYKTMVLWMPASLSSVGSLPYFLDPIFFFIFVFFLILMEHFLQWLPKKEYREA